MERPTVAHLIATNFYGGPERQIVAHACRVGAAGYEPLVISFAESGRDNELLAEAGRHGLRHRALRVDGAFNPRAVSSLVSLLRDEGVRLLCTHGYKSNVVGRLAAWIAGIPEIAVSRGWTAENARIRFYERLDRLFLRLADRVVAVSEGQRAKILKSGVRPGKVSVIRNCFALDEEEQRAEPGAPARLRVRRELGIPEDAVLVASAGRLSPEKNYAGFIEVARRVRRAEPSVHFAVFGEGFLRPDLERAIAQAGLQDAFLLPGFRKDMPAVYEALDIFVLPSFTEGLPNVVLEAFARRRPVVASAVGGTPEVVTHGKDGFLTAPTDLDGLAGFVLRLARDPQLRRDMGAAGRETLRERFDFARQTEDWVALYRSLLSGRDLGAQDRGGVHAS